MTKAKGTDVVIDPEIRSHTGRILALQEDERQTRKDGAELHERGEILKKTEALPFFSGWIPPSCTGLPRCPTRSPPLSRRIRT